jgi:(p)ppGpp synthase/HD superfamily hydrolase
MDRQRNAADVSLRIDILDLEQLSRILHRLSRLPNVISAQRRSSG